MKTLIEVNEGEKVKIGHLNCGHGLKHRLCSLGLLCGQEIEVIKNDTNGPIILKVFDSKLVIGRGQAAKITVE